MKKYLYIISLILISLSCTNEVDIIFPEFKDGSILEGTIPLPDYSKERMEGVYQFIEGNDFFKDKAVVKWSDPDLLSIFCEKDGAYMVLKGGVSGSSIFFEGTWRYSYGTETGLVRLSITPENGGTELLGDSTSNFKVEFDGKFGEGNDRMANGCCRAQGGRDQICLWPAGQSKLPVRRIVRRNGDPADPGAPRGRWWVYGYGLCAAKWGTGGLFRQPGAWRSQPGASHT